MAGEFIYSSKMGVLVKAESVSGVEETPDPKLNALMCAESSVKPMINMIELDRYAHANISAGAVPGKRSVDLSLKVPLVGAQARPGYENLDPPDFDPLLQASGYTKVTIRQANHAACVRSGKSQGFDISGGAIIEFQVDADAGTAGTVVTLTLDHANSTKYPAPTRATAAQIVADVGAAAVSGGATLTAYRGYLYLRSAATDNTAKVQVLPSTAEVFQFPTAGRESAWAGPFNISAGAVIAFAVEGGSTVTCTLTHGSSAIYADNTRATADEIISDIASAVTSGGATISNRFGRLYLRSNEDDGTGKLAIISTTSDIFGFVETAAASGETGVVTGSRLVTRYDYVPDSYQQYPTCTVWCYMFPQGAKVDNRAYLIRARGCAFDAEFTTDVNGESYITFAGKGAWVSVGDTATFPKGWRYRHRGDALVAMGGTISFDAKDGSTPRQDPFGQLSLKGNYDVKERDDQGSQYGIKGFFIDRKGKSMSGSFNPEVKMVAEFDKFSLVGSANANEMSAAYQSARGSTLTISIPDLQYGNPEWSADGIVRFEQGFYCRDITDDLDNHITLSFGSVAV